MSLNHRILQICLTFTVIASFVRISDAQAECKTPNQAPGTCIGIRNCPALVALLQKRPVAPRDADFLRKSQCGFTGDDPKVCCPSNGNSNGGASQQTIDPAKLRLLPDPKKCGVSTDNRIVGGEKTDLDEFPWMALIEYKKPNGRGFYCGGVLISDRYVLTAAHCVKGKDLPKTWTLSSVRLGEYDTSSNKDCVPNGVGGEDCNDDPVDIAVEERIAHEGYNPLDTNQYNDIALLRLSRPVVFTEFIQPICIPTTKMELESDFIGKNLSVAGWGKTESKSESNIKLKIQVPVRANSECGQVYRSAGVQLGKGQLCAGGLKGKDSCRGDSGGPLMSFTIREDGNAHWTCAGIVSFGPSPCGMQGWPGVYTRVTEYAPWIINKLKP